MTIRPGQCATEAHTANAVAIIDREVRCTRCRYHYRRSLMVEAPDGLVCRDDVRCDQNIATRRHFDAQKRRR